MSLGFAAVFAAIILFGSGWARLFALVVVGFIGVLTWLVMA